MTVKKDVEDFLEHYGVQEIDPKVENFLSHYGKKGMKWGVRRAQARAEKGPDRFGNRNNASFQRRQDRMKRVAKGEASTGDLIKSGLFDIPVVNVVQELSLSGGARLTLEKNKRAQNKINAGKANVTDILNRLGGIDVRELNFDV